VDEDPKDNQSGSLDSESVQIVAFPSFATLHFEILKISAVSETFPVPQISARLMRRSRQALALKTKCHSCEGRQ
jgi:hypothetical protein